MKRILFSLFAVFVLAGTAGFYVFEHSCKMDGTDSHLYSASQHVCGDEPEVESCCHNETAQNDTKDCCDDEVKVIQLDYDYFHDNEGFDFISFECCTCHVPCFAFEFEENPELTSTGINGSPLVRSGRSIAISHQVFRC